jgi:ABC-type sugar transport system substrate-binding protein
VKEGSGVDDIPVFNATFDPQKLSGQIRDAIASQKYDALVIHPVTGASIPDVEAALDADLKVATVLSPLVDPAGNEIVDGQTISTTRRRIERQDGPVQRGYQHAKRVC